MVLDSKTLSQSVPANFSIGQNHVLSLQVTSAPYFKGVLFRLGSNGKVDTTKALSVRSGDTSLRLAYDTCIPLGAGGVTHRSDKEKRIATSILRMNRVAANLPLDVTVVVANDDGISKFFYARFSLNAVARRGVAAPTPTVSANVRPASMPQLVQHPMPHLTPTSGGDN